MRAARCGVPVRLSEGEREALLASCDSNTLRGARDAAMALCMGVFRLRAACDVANLSLDDISWAHGTLAVHGSKSRTGRVLPLDGRTKAALKRYTTMHRKAEGTCSLFLSTAGTPMRPHQVHTAMSLAGGRARIEAYHKTHGAAQDGGHEHGQCGDRREDHRGRAGARARGYDDGIREGQHGEPVQGRVAVAQRGAAVSGSEEMADRCIAYKRALGFDFAGEARGLCSFAAFLRSCDTTKEAALAWACSRAGHPRAYQAQRYETVRRFSRFAHALDPAFPTMHPGLLKSTSERIVPYIYSEEDTCLLMRKALSAGSSDSLKGEGLAFLIGLMGSCGLRAGGRSALRMPTSMRMLRPLATRDSKFDAPRTIPVSPITAERIAGRSRKKGSGAPDSMIVSGGEAPQQGLCGRHVLKETLDASGQR